MENVTGIVNSPNFLYLAGFVLVAIVVLAWLSKKGFFSYNGKGLKVGRSENDARIMLMRQVDFVGAFILCKEQELMTDFHKAGMPPDEMHVKYVFEKMLDQVMYWLLVNNIRLDRQYVQAKANESRMTINAAIGEVNKRLLEMPQVQEIVERISVEYTEELLSGLVQIKIEEEKNAG